MANEPLFQLQRNEKSLFLFILKARAIRFQSRGLHL